MLVILGHTDSSYKSDSYGESVLLKEGKHLAKTFPKNNFSCLNIVSSVIYLKRKKQKYGYNQFLNIFSVYFLLLFT